MVSETQRTRSQGLVLLLKVRQFADKCANLSHCLGLMPLLNTMVKEMQRGGGIDKILAYLIVLVDTFGYLIEQAADNGKVQIT
jgi:hypothetical protein